MPTSTEINRIQSFLRENVRAHHQVVCVPPFTIFFHPADPFKYFNYAIPDGPTQDDLSKPLAQLRTEFQSRGRIPRFEFFEAFAPQLPAALTANGFVEEARQWSMICTPTSLQSVPEVACLEVTQLTGASPEADIRDFIIVQQEGFDPGTPAHPDAEKITQQREDFKNWRAFLGRIDGQPAGVSLYSAPLDGVTEVAGVATLVNFRRRGIAAALTWTVVQAAFTEGATTACLTAADANAGRVYEKIGFQPFSTMLAYIDAAAAEG